MHLWSRLFLMGDNLEWLFNALFIFFQIFNTKDRFSHFLAVKYKFKTINLVKSRHVAINENNFVVHKKQTRREDAWAMRINNVLNLLFVINLCAVVDWKIELTKFRNTGRCLSSVKQFVISFNCSQTDVTFRLNDLSMDNLSSNTSWNGYLSQRNFWYDIGWKIYSVLSFTSFSVLLLFVSFSGSRYL